MTQYWWVNHKQTVIQEIEGSYLWSPKTNRDRRRNHFYDNMRRASPGDLVLSYANQFIGAVGRVAEFAFTAPKPSEFGSAGANWLNDGWLLPVFWTALARPARPKALINALRPLLPKKYSPIRPNTGDGNQSVYLASVSREVFQTVIAGLPLDYELLMRGGANSLIPAALSADRCPFSGGDRSDAYLVGHKPIPSVAAGLDDVLVATPDASAELVGAEILPDVLDRIEFG